MRKSLIAAALMLAVTGCRGDDPPSDQRTGDMSVDEIRQARANWPEGLGELVDSANAAYAAGNYDAAAELFRRATRMGPDVTATWFGVYMTEHARGNIAAADSAMARAQALSPGASLIHDDGTVPTATDSSRRSPHPDTTGR